VVPATRAPVARRLPLRITADRVGEATHEHTGCVVGRCPRGLCLGGVKAQAAAPAAKAPVTAIQKVTTPRSMHCPTGAGSGY